MLPILTLFHCLSTVQRSWHCTVNVTNFFGFSVVFLSVQVCKDAGVELHMVPLTDQYWDRVVAHSIAEIKAGRTPNPDILCNSRCKLLINSAACLISRLSHHDSELCCLMFHSPAIILVYNISSTSSGLF